MSEQAKQNNQLIHKQIQTHEDFRWDTLHLIANQNKYYLKELLVGYTTFNENATDRESEKANDSAQQLIAYDLCARCKFFDPERSKALWYSISIAIKIFGDLDYPEDYFDASRKPFEPSWNCANSNALLVELSNWIVKPYADCDHWNMLHPGVYALVFAYLHEFFDPLIQSAKRSLRLSSLQVAKLILEHAKSAPITYADLRRKLFRPSRDASPKRS